jgi:hypothetical protein
MTAILQHDRLTGRAWLEFSSRPDESTIAKLKAAGWRWSGYRRPWHRPGRHSVPPDGIAFEDAGECDFSEERADRLEARAEKAQAAGSAMVARADEMASLIPLGQPILCGHHSEQRDRRYRERIDNTPGRGFEQLKQAKRLESAAEASRIHQEHLQSAGCLLRRIDRMNAELRRMKRFQARVSAERRAEWDKRIDQQRADIAREEAALAEIGGAPKVEVAKGDVVEIRGHIVRVERVNPRTIAGTIIRGGAEGMHGRWDRSWLKGVVSRG